ncbi:MAG: heavy-metal-associated domain-containing protein [Ignavibacteriae bacterium]|nr:copper chaperone [Ignavibacteriota bacterium]NOG99772.1 heavy-metal-associated domain-containing protein [Ignavibacteriota bacterium]
MQSRRRKSIVIFIFCVTTVFAQSNEVTVRVDGLSCPFCAYGLEKKLNDIKGVENINIDIEEGLIILKIVEGKIISEEELREKIRDAGFTPKEIVFTNKDKKTREKE